MAKRKRNTTKAAKAAKAATVEVLAAWVPDQIEHWDVERLRPADRNPRKHPPKQIEQLAERYKAVGFTKPMLVRHDGRIIAGHGRWEAAKIAGLKTVPVIVAPKEWTDDQCRAELLADNALGDGSKWDEEELGAELALLTQAGFDLKPLGFAPLKDEGGGESPDASAQLQGLSYAVVVRCKDEAHQGELLARFEEEGLTCEALIS
jgi:ParB-like chromosome segregation protein Spo0J